MVGDSWIKKRNAWINQRLGPNPMLQRSVQDADGDYGDPQANYDWQQQWDAKVEEFRAQLSPEARASYDGDMQARHSSFDKINTIGKTAALGVIGASAGGLGLQLAGAAGAGSGVSAAEIAAAAGSPELGLAAQTGLATGFEGGLAGASAAEMEAITSALTSQGMSLAEADAALAAFDAAVPAATIDAAVKAGGSTLANLAKTALASPLAKSVLTGGSGGGGSSAFRNTLTGKVTDAQEDLNSDMNDAMGDQLAFNREQFDYYKGLSDKQYQLGQDTYNWNRGLAEDAKARADRFDSLYFDTTGRQLRQFSNDVDNYNAPAEGLRMSGRAMADVESQMDNARGAYLRGMTSRGWNPNSAALQSSMSDMEAAKREGLNLRAMAAGLGQPNANVATTNTGLSGDVALGGLKGSNDSMTPGYTNLSLYNQGQNTGVNWGNAANSGYNAMRTGNSSWSDNINYGNMLLGGLRGYATNGGWGAVAGAVGGALGGG
jgi:hypothetical protein